MEKWKVVVVHTGAGTSYKQYRGLSTWKKPMNADTGDELVEMDTCKVFMFDSETPKWWGLNDKNNPL